MSASRISLSLAAAMFGVAVLTPQPALSQSLPLALPPSADTKPAQPITAPPPTPAAVGLALPSPAPSATAVPVETQKLGEVKNDSIGLITDRDGGLGAGLWQGTPRLTVERFLPMLAPPLPFAALNDLARRFLSTEAGSSEGSGDESAKQLLTSLRIDRLVQLGDAAAAWQLAALPGLGAIDDAVVRRAAEAALVSPAADKACAQLPGLIQQHTAVIWQKLMVVCQLRAKDSKAAQVSLDLLHAQDVHDDVFFALAEKNLLGNAKQLPRQLTPLTPLNLALLHLADLPLRSEIYARPDAALIPELLKSQPVDPVARTALAERAAAKGLIGVNLLENTYNSQTFAADIIANPAGSLEQGPTLRALLYQAARQEKAPKARVVDAIQFFASLDTAIMGGGVLTAMGSMLGDLPTSTDAGDTVAVLRLFLLAGREDGAASWLLAARGAAAHASPVMADLQHIWPLIVLSGHETEADLLKNQALWLNGAMPRGDAGDAEAKSQKAAAASLLLLIDAAGFPVGDTAWAMVADTAAAEKIQAPPALVLQRLRASGMAGRKGETVLMGLLASSGNGKDDPPLLAILETVRGLHAVGLQSDALALAKEEAVRIMYPPAKP